MRVLSLDLGNTSLKGVLWSEGTAELCFRLGLEESIPRALQASLSRVRETVGVASHGVRERAPGVLSSLRSCLRAAPCWVGVDVDPPARVAYDEPGELGLDRRLAAWGAHLAHGDALVVDGGTAVTVTHVDVDGCVRGMSIGAGLRTTRAALGVAAPALEAFLGGAVPRGLPRGTRDNLAIGIDLAWDAGLRGLVDDAVTRLARHGIARGELLLTGSDAERVQRALGGGVLAPGLVHCGLVSLVGAQ